MSKKTRQLEAEIERLKSNARRMYSKGYSDAGASFHKRALKAFKANSGSPTEDIDPNNSTLRQRSRMLYMASPIAAGAINTNRTKVVGSGLRMKCAIDSDILGISEDAARQWQKNTEAEWQMWCEKKTCDALEMNNFYELQQLAIKSWLMSGDVFALFKRNDRTENNPYTLRIHLIEADRVSTPNMSSGFVHSPTEGKNNENGNKIYDGVEVDDNGRVIAYYVCNSYPGQHMSEGLNWQRVLTVGEKSGLPNILHIVNSERPDQYRGVSYLAPVIEMLLQQRRYTESELTAALIQSYFTAWITTQTDTSDFPLNEVEEPQVSDSDVEYEMGPGQVNHLAPGESVTLGNPNIPTAGYETFTKSNVKQIGSGLELPYDVLIKEFNSSYSSAKGALEEARETFKMRRSWFVNDFCQPIYETWLAEAVAIGRIKAPGFFVDPKIRAAWCGARWDGPAQTHLDPVKEARAAEIQVKNGWKTNEQVTREYYGGDWHENVTALKEETELFGAVQETLIKEEEDE